MKKFECPVCGENTMGIRKLREGQCFPCTNCESILEVIHTDPIELDVYYSEGDEPVLRFNDPNTYHHKDVLKCRVCERRIYPDKTLWIGDVVACRICGAEHQVINLKPIELDVPYDGSDTDFIDEDLEGYFYDVHQEK